MSKTTTTKNREPHVAVDGKAELVPASVALPKKLHVELLALEEKLHAIDEPLFRTAEQLLWLILQRGFYLLKIRALYRLSAEQKGSLGGKAKAKKLACDTCHELDGDHLDAGFSAWIGDDESKRRAAYRHMNVPLNLGLTENDTEASLANVRPQLAAYTGRISDLYKKPKQLNAPPSGDAGDGQLELQLVTETVRESDKICTNLINLRDQMDEETLRVVVEKLVETLDELTGAEWDIVDVGGKSKKRKVERHGE